MSVEKIQELVKYVKISRCKNANELRCTAQSGTRVAPNNGTGHSGANRVGHKGCANAMRERVGGNTKEESSSFSDTAENTE